MLLFANVAASALHFGDNMLRFDEYPEPKWIGRPHTVDTLWLAMTPLLAIGWWLARREMKRSSVGVLWTYGVLSLFALGHYFYTSPAQLALRINLLIALEVIAAVLLILLAPGAVFDRRRGAPR